MNSPPKRILPLVMLLIVLSLFLSACLGPTEREWLKSEGWGRAQRVAETHIAQPASFALDDAGRIYTFVATREDDRSYPRLVAFNRRGEILWDTAFDIPLKTPKALQIVWDGSALWLFWIDENRFYTIPVSTSGKLYGEPILLSGEFLVGNYALALDAENRIITWFGGTESQPGVYARRPGDWVGAPQLVDVLGVAPDLKLSPDGRLYAIWMHDDRDAGDNRVYFGSYPGGVYQAARDVVVTEIPLHTSDGFEGPFLGVDATHAYILWTISIRTGLRAGVTEASYVSFSLVDPGAGSPKQLLSVPVSYEVEPQPFSASDFQVGDRLLLAEGLPQVTEHVTKISTQADPRSELAIAARLYMDYLMRKREFQVIVVFFEAGKPTSYQLVSFTTADSTHPFIRSDKDGYLYLTWLEQVGESGSMVYFTSTAPDIRQALASLTGDDFARMGLDTFFGMLTGALWVPFALVWIIAPLILIGLTSRLRKEDEKLTSTGSISSVVLALLSYWVSKVTMLPAIREYVPFSSWIPILPEWLGLPLKIGVPLLITLLALWIAWLATYRRDRRSVLFFFLVYAVVDGVLSMAIYGVIMQGAF